jgi:hypothetical protein
MNFFNHDKQNSFLHEIAALMYFYFAYLAVRVCKRVCLDIDGEREAERGCERYRKSGNRERGKGGVRESGKR